MKFQDSYEVSLYRGDKSKVNLSVENSLKNLCGSFSQIKDQKVSAIVN